ncbi:FMN-binding negative transcriptional regulator [Collimonas fungivorans]|uniref:FMN-binding negative transcriptional regulator n=1 Tax=Collimonas fungivorans TaxID=158899 RepID=UPI00077820EA|nr:FMN-binding negative transcriptional regulator [Collimonas fungivorans]
MYVPEYYRVDENTARELVYRHPLALLVCNGNNGLPWATHLPAIFPPETRKLLDQGESIIGKTMYGHMNRINPHWNALQAGSALLIFQGPNSYVSPTVYEVTPAAPTWNFTSTHLRGTLRPIDERDQILEIVRWTVATFEKEFCTNWDLTESIPYFERIVHGVGAFAFEVESFDSMFKLSQEQPAAIQERVVNSFASSSHCPHKEIADLMQRTNSKNKK